MIKEANWGECLNKGSAELRKEDKGKANSLRKTAEGRISFFSNIEITEENVDYIFEGFYTSLIEILHSLLIIKGYKVSNHICLGFYLRDVLNKKGLFRIFDNLRFNRNSIVYYGKGMDIKIGKDAIKKCKKLIKEIKKLN